MKRFIFIILCLEGAVLSFNVAAAMALVPSIAAYFNLSHFVVGRIGWLYMLPYGLAALVYGPLVRRFSARKIELIFFLAFSAANLSAALAKNIYALYFARFCMGIFGASVIPLALILIANHTEQQRRGRLVGIFFGSTFAASLAGLFLSGILNWRLIFLIPAISGFIVWGLIYFYLPSYEEDKSSFKINYINCLKDRLVLSIFAYIFFISLFYHGIQQWFSVYFADKFNLSQFNISILITLTSLSGIFGEVIGGMSADKLGRKRTVNFGILLMISSIFILLFRMPIGILGILMFVWGLGWTFNHAGLSTMLTDLPGKFLNEAASLNSGVRFISGGLGVALGGIMMQKNLHLNFIVFGLCLLILLVFVRLPNTLKNV